MKKIKFATYAIYPLLVLAMFSWILGLHDRCIFFMIASVFVQVTINERRIKKLAELVGGD